MKSKQRKRTGLHREGRKMLLVVALIAFIINLAAYFYWPHWILATTLALSAVALVFVVYFFRDPVRVFTIDDPNYLVAPADGKVVVIEPVMENEYFHEERLQVSIFMSPFNVISGIIDDNTLLFLRIAHPSCQLLARQHRTYRVIGQRRIPGRIISKQRT